MWIVIATLGVEHLLGSLSSRQRALIASYGETDDASVSHHSGEVCIRGGTTYADIQREGIIVPSPSCASISVLGHLVSDGHGRLAHDEIWLRDHLVRVELDDGWRDVTSPSEALELTLGAGHGRVHGACFAGWAAMEDHAYGLSQTMRLTRHLEDSDVRAATVVWMSSTFAVMEAPADAENRVRVDWSVQLVSWLADLPGVTSFTRQVPGFYEFTALLRGLVVWSGRLHTARVPNPILAPCSVHAEDAEVQFPWADWIARWRDIVDALRGGVSLILKKADDVAILDVQAAVGREDVVDAVVARVCAIVTHCRLHVGKSVPTEWAQRTFAAYNVSRTTPEVCYHPFCARDGVARPYVSARGRQDWWTL